MPPFFAHGCAYAGRPWMATSSIRSNCIHLNITGNSNSHCYAYAGRPWMATSSIRSNSIQLNIIKNMN